MVALDACFTKNKKYPTQLFFAMVHDGNSQIVPLAYALAPVENFENWMWFLHNLRISIQGLSSEEVFIVSDRQKGLEKVVSEVFLENPHMHCGHHLKMNMQKHFGKVAVQCSEERNAMQKRAFRERNAGLMTIGVPVNGTLFSAKPALMIHQKIYLRAFQEPGTPSDKIFFV
ncbi:hypothetical protein R1sor_022545 [Riccia sorocarpa]|uniref:MULE transposase domain-containing protein n=1 Tax=Riccia sorocarpa TaxID=122646 RepID=A0ABD3GMC0_9MARC